MLMRYQQHEREMHAALGDSITSATMRKMGKYEKKWK